MQFQDLLTHKLLGPSIQELLTHKLLGPSINATQIVKV